MPENSYSHCDDDHDDENLDCKHRNRSHQTEGHHPGGEDGIREQFIAQVPKILTHSSIFSIMGPYVWTISAENPPVHNHLVPLRCNMKVVFGFSSTEQISALLANLHCEAKRSKSFYRTCSSGTEDV